jgi:hypothetical protein
MLIKKCKKEFSEGLELFEEIDAWRLERNKAIHGFIESSGNSLGKYQDSFYKSSEETAKKGQTLCIKVCDWYFDCSVRFFETSFSSKALKN